MARASLYAQNRVTEEELRSFPTPLGTSTHIPIEHGRFVDLLDGSLNDHGWEITDKDYGIWPSKINDVLYDAARMFGVYKIAREDVAKSDDVELALGIRNSHDKTFAADVVIGINVMVCDNLDFVGEVKASHKHTVNLMDQLPQRIFDMLGEIVWIEEDHTRMIDLYKWAQIDDTQVHDFIVKSVDAHVMPWTYGERVLREYRKPRHEVFEERNVWSLNNSYTEILKDRNQMMLSTSTVRLHRLLRELSESVAVTSGWTLPEPSEN